MESKIRGERYTATTTCVGEGGVEGYGGEDDWKRCAASGAGDERTEELGQWRVKSGRVVRLPRSVAPQELRRGGEISVPPQGRSRAGRRPCPLVRRVGRARSGAIVSMEAACSVRAHGEHTIDDRRQKIYTNQARHRCVKSSPFQQQFLLEISMICKKRADRGSADNPLSRVRFVSCFAQQIQQRQTAERHTEFVAQFRC